MTWQSSGEQAHGPNEFVSRYSFRMGWFKYGIRHLSFGGSFVLRLRERNPRDEPNRAIVSSLPKFIRTMATSTFTSFGAAIALFCSEVLSLIFVAANWAKPMTFGVQIYFTSL